MKPAERAVHSQKAVSRHRVGRRLLLALLWVWLVLYFPRPWDLPITIYRTVSPPVDALAVSALSETLPDDPAAIDSLIRSEVIPYAYDWTVYDQPWYFATAGESLASGRGDCESQAIVLASVFAQKGIPHTLKVSFDHIWVEYPKKRDNSIEKDALAVAEHVNGELRVKAPDEFDLRKFLDAHGQAHWDPMPPWRKWMLALGLLMLLLTDPQRMMIAWRRFNGSARSIQPSHSPN